MNLISEQELPHFNGLLPHITELDKAVLDLTTNKGSNTKNINYNNNNHNNSSYINNNNSELTFFSLFSIGEVKQKTNELNFRQESIFRAFRFSSWNYYHSFWFTHFKAEALTRSYQCCWL